jgi:hypothetical protein
MREVNRLICIHCGTRLILAIGGASERVRQAAMRHSDPKLTANVYTDVSHLPTAAAVASLPQMLPDHLRDHYKTEGQGDPQIDPQAADFPCPEVSQADELNETENQSEHPQSKEESRGVTRADSTSQNKAIGSGSWIRTNDGRCNCLISITRAATLTLPPAPRSAVPESRPRGSERRSGLPGAVRARVRGSTKGRPRAGDPLRRAQVAPRRFEGDVCAGEETRRQGRLGRPPLDCSGIAGTRKVPTSSAEAKSVSPSESRNAVSACGNRGSIPTARRQCKHSLRSHGAKIVVSIGSDLAKRQVLFVPAVNSFKVPGFFSNAPLLCDATRRQTGRPFDCKNTVSTLFVVPEPLCDFDQRIRE